MLVPQVRASRRSQQHCQHKERGEVTQEVAKLLGKH